MKILPKKGAAHVQRKRGCSRALAKKILSHISHLSAKEQSCEREVVADPAICFSVHKTMYSRAQAAILLHGLLILLFGLICLSNHHSLAILSTTNQEEQPTRHTQKKESHIIVTHYYIDLLPFLYFIDT